MLLNFRVVAAFAGVVEGGINVLPKVTAVNKANSFRFVIPKTPFLYKV